MTKMQIFKYTKEIILILISLGLIIKILATDFSGFDLPENLTDYTSLALALFSIWLSALFYFRANEASNKFYDNTYQFTKDISEKIGRIEERFGKDLTNIEKGYSRMLDKIDRLPLSESLQEEIESKKSNEQQLVEEKENIINELILKANLSQEEKDRISSQLNAKELELENVKGQLFELKNQLKMVEKNNRILYSEFPHTRNLIEFILRSIISNPGLPNKKEELLELVEKRVAMLDDNDINILIQENIINKNLKISRKGRQVVMHIFRETS